MLRVLDLFSGIGGFSLGLERTGGFQTVAFCEIEPYPRAVLKKHWPDVPIYEDVRTLPRHGDIDLVCGGFPCQPFSSAARGRNNAPDLWPYMLQVIRSEHPRYVIAENVSRVDACHVAEDLERSGYVVWILDTDRTPGRHKRRRFYFVANSNFYGEPRRAINAQMACFFDLSGRNHADDAIAVGADDGLPGRVDRLRALGNAVVPQIPEMIGRAILQSMEAQDAA